MIRDFLHGVWEDGRWSSKHNFIKSKPLLVKSASGPEQDKGEEVGPVFCFQDQFGPGVI